MAVTEETKHVIYQKLKSNLEKFAPPMAANEKPLKNSFELIGNKPVPYGYSKKMVPGMFFASIEHCKDSVALHFFPLYLDPKLKERIPTLNKYLKGKTCFHFNKEEQVDELELQTILKIGIEKWKELGYMKPS